MKKKTKKTLAGIRGEGKFVKIFLFYLKEEEERSNLMNERYLSLLLLLLLLLLLRKSLIWSVVCVQRLMKEQVIQASNPLSEPCQRGNSRDISGINKTLLQLSQDKIALICRHIGTETQEGD